MSSILTGSTIFPAQNQGKLGKHIPASRPVTRERNAKSSGKGGENPGTLDTACSEPSAREFTAHKLAWHRRVLGCADLTALAKNVAGVLLHHLNAKTGDCWPSQDEIADVLGVTRRAVQLSLDALAATGFIVIKAGRGRGIRNRYEAVFAPATPPKSANGGSPQASPEKANPDSEKGESSFAQESLIEPLNPPTPPAPPDDAWWSEARAAYPRSRASPAAWQQARKHAFRLVHRGTVSAQTVSAAFRRYAKDVAGKDHTFVVWPTTFLRNAMWESYPALDLDLPAMSQARLEALRREAAENDARREAQRQVRLQRLDDELRKAGIRTGAA